MLCVMPFVIVAESVVGRSRKMEKPHTGTGRIRTLSVIENVSCALLMLAVLVDWVRLVEELVALFGFGSEVKGCVQTWGRSCCSINIEVGTEVPFIDDDPDEMRCVNVHIFRFD